MEKKNTLLLTVIAVATLLVAVVGATFAYFASGSNLADVGTTVTTEGSDLTFVSNGTALSMAVLSNEMQQANGNDDMTVFDTADGTVVATINSAEALVGDPRTCSFDVYYEWTSTGDDVYTAFSPGKAAAVTKEFTLATTGNEDEVAEFNLSNNISDTQQWSEGAPRRILLFQDAVTLPTGQTTASETYTVTMKFYNLAHDQSPLSEKEYTGRVYVTNVVC